MKRLRDIERLSPSEAPIQLRTITTKAILDPYLSSARDKLLEAEACFRGERGVLWNPVVILYHDALMLALQRIIIDKKGLKVIENLRKARRLHLSTLIRILEREGKLTPEEIKNFEMLRDLRDSTRRLSRYKITGRIGTRNSDEVHFKEVSRSTY